MSYTGSVMDNCCGCADEAREIHGEVFESDEAADASDPPASLATAVAAVLAKDWSDLAGLAYFDPPSTSSDQAFRGQRRVSPSSSWATITGSDFSGGGPGVGLFGLMLLGIANSAVTTGAFGSSLHTVFPTSPENLWAGGYQASCWLWNPGSDTNVYPAVSRGRHKRATSGNAFVFTGEIWTGWSDFNSRDRGGLGPFGGGIYNATLLVNDFTIPANTWYEPAFPSTSAPGSFHVLSGGSEYGFLGRVTIVVRGETRTAFNARTGLSL